MYTHHIFLYPFIYWSNLGCFHVLAIINHVSMNIGVQVSFQMSVFVFFRYIARSGIAESYGSFIFSFFEELPYCFPQWLHQFTFALIVYTWVLFSLHLSKFLLFVVFLMTAILAGVRWSHCGFDLHFSDSDINHLFICRQSVCLLWKYVYSGLLPIFDWVVCLFWYWIVWAVCMFGKLSPRQLHHL